MRTSVNPYPEGVREVYAEEGSALYLLDLPIPLPGFDHHLSSWLLRDFKRGRNVLVDTGPSAPIPFLERSLRSLGVGRVDLVLLTHIHADHAGGTGRLLDSFPEARVLAPERGRAHLVHPARLAEGTRATLGTEMADAFGPILPVPKESLIDSGDPLLEGVTVLETPGHASHHSSYVFHADCGTVLFPGDAAGIASVAMVPLGRKCEVGILAIGSSDSNRFNPTMSTDFLARIGDLASAALSAARQRLETARAGA